MPPDHLDHAIAAIQLIEAEGFEVILVGAVARELVFDRKLGDRHHRATRDVDAAVRIGSWASYEALVAKLIEVLGFRRAEPDGLKFVHDDGTELDVLPYGAIGDHQGTLRWPTDSTRTMSMRAFATIDARTTKSALGGIVVRVPALADLVALKVVAYEARRHETSKDLEDLVFILSEATRALTPDIYDRLDPGIVESLAYEDLGPYWLGNEQARHVGRDGAADLAATVQLFILDGPAYVALGRVTGHEGLDNAVARFVSLCAGLLGVPAEYE